MAEPISIQQLKDASLDVKSLEEVVNGDENVVVTTRLGETYPSVKGSIKTLFENGGLPATPFKTKALMTASALVDGKYAMVTDDTVNNGLYVKTAGAWVKSAYDLLGEVENILKSGLFVSDAIGSDGFNIDGNVLGNGTDGDSTSYVRTDYLPVVGGNSYKYQTATRSAAQHAWYDKNKAFISQFGFNSNLSDEGIVVAPDNAAYVRLSTQLSQVDMSYFKYQVLEINKKTLLDSVADTIVDKALADLILDYGQSTLTLSGYIFKETGAFDPFTSYKSTDFLNIVGGEEYIVNIPSYSTNAGSVWYDKDKNYISQVAVLDGETVAPTNAAYVRVSALNNFTGMFFKSKRPIGQLVESKAYTDSKIDELESRVPNTSDALATNQKVVKYVSDLFANNTGYYKEGAFPIGSTAYVESLRAPVYADGIFWRTSDGYPAELARQTYVFPKFKEVLENLSNYAAESSVLVNMESLVLDGEYGFSTPPRIVNGVMEIVLKKADGGNGAVDIPVNPSDIKTNIAFEFEADDKDTSSIQVSFLNQNKEVVASSVTGADDFRSAQGGNYFDIRNVFSKFNVLLNIKNNFTITGDTFNKDSVAYIRIKPVYRGLSTTTETFIKVHNIYSARFKPKVILRFDDQHSSVYEKAKPIMDSYGFKGLIAVITGAYSTEGSFYDWTNRMTIEQLLEVQDIGWDLVSHTRDHIQTLSGTDTELYHEYKDSQEFLRDVLKVPLLSSSILINPRGQRDERVAKLQREFYGCSINKTNAYNPAIPKDSLGAWSFVGTWETLGAITGDGSTTSEQLINSLSKCIDNEGVAVIMMHQISDVQPLRALDTLTEAFAGLCEYLDANRDIIDVVTITDIVNSMEGR